MIESSSNDRAARIRGIVKKSIQLWSEGSTGHELEMVDANPDLAPELAHELKKARLAILAAQKEQPPAPPNEGLRVRCPHCRNPMELLESEYSLDAPPDAMSCESCGEEISILADTTNYDATHRLGSFHLEEQLGTGSFGTVWRAYDEELDRDVAVKIPRRSQMSSSGDEQFMREARITAQLKHPNIVSVHEVGRESDTFYIVSDLVEGVTLSRWLADRGNLSPKDAAGLCEKLARAVEHAHQRGVIHRDLKPANIMMEWDDNPQIMDFGLAKRDVAEITMTADGVVLGTPAYMSPEQAKGESFRVDGRSDVYSLGVILFELLTGELPFRGGQRMLIQQVIHDEPPSPRKFAARVPRDLETICLKCLAKERVGRYSSSMALAEDLARFARGEPIQARPSSRVDKAWRWSKRNPVAAALLALISLLAIVGPAFGWHERHQRLLITKLDRENQNVIRRLRENSQRMSDEIAELNRNALILDGGSQEIDLASVLLSKLDAFDARAPRINIAKGILCAEVGRTDDAVGAFERALEKLGDDHDEAKLARADCLWRLAGLLRTSAPQAALARIDECVRMLRSMDQAGHASLLSIGLEQRARARRTILSLENQTQSLGDAIEAFENSTQATSGLTDDSVLTGKLPTSPQVLYAFVHGWFTRVPPLLTEPGD